MSEFTISVLSTIVVSLVAVVFFSTLYHLTDIYLVLTKRDFGNVDIQVMYFTRHDYQKSGDALHSRTVCTGVSLRDVYKNRILFLRILYASFRVKADQPVLNFGKRKESLIAPLRGRVLEMFVVEEFGRIAGEPFRQTEYQMSVVHDKSKNRRILRVIMMRKDDLEKLSDYLKKPPSAGKNFDLYKKIAEAYIQKTASFLPVKIVTRM